MNLKKKKKVLYLKILRTQWGGFLRRDFLYGRKGCCHRYFLILVLYFTPILSKVVKLFHILLPLSACDKIINLKKKEKNGQKYLELNF